MGSSGTSGTLRFASAAGDAYFIVALGVHNYKPWVDIAVYQSSSDTCVHVHPAWYQEGTDKAKVRWEQLTKMDKMNKAGVCITAEGVKSADHEYWVNIVIG